MNKLPIRKVTTTREFLLLDEEARRLHEERQRALHDYVSDIEGAREEGRGEGRGEGELHRARTTAQKMLRTGMDGNKFLTLWICPWSKWKKSNGN